MRERRNDLETINWYPQIALQIQNSDRSPLYDVRNPAGKVCKDVACEVMFRGRLFEAPCSSTASFSRMASSFDFIWWSQTGSNRRPHACKARALPAELWPRTRRRMLLRAPGVLAFAGASAQQPSFKMACRAEAAEQRRLVGLGRLELPTSRLSSARSNQLSYKPLTHSLKGSGHARASGRHRRGGTRAAPGACSSGKKEKRGGGNPANGAQRSGD